MRTGDEHLGEEATVGRVRRDSRAERVHSRMGVQGVRRRPRAREVRQLARRSLSRDDGADVATGRASRRTIGRPRDDAHPLRERVEERIAAALAEEQPLMEPANAGSEGTFEGRGYVDHPERPELA
jgi:hypothetical protein